MKASYVLFIFFTFWINVYAKKSGENYYDLFLNVKNRSQVVELIQRSPNIYAKIVDLISKSTDLRTLSLSKNLNNLPFRENIFLDNVTDVPVLETTTSTTEIPQTSTETPKVSDLCQKHIDGLVQGINEQKPWALKMVDATGKPSSNILGGGLRWVGDYEECLEVQATVNEQNKTYSFDGQYCMLSVINLQPIPPIFIGPTPINIGMCLPDSCSEDDALLVVNKALMNVTQFRFLAYEADCQEPDKPFDTRAVIVLVVIAFFITMMVTGTAYDVLLIQWPKWKAEKIHSELKDETVVEANEKSPLIGQKNYDVNYEPGIFGNILLSFSIYTNGAKLLNTDQARGTLTAVNGIRFISMTWVILGHAYVFVINEADNFASFLPRMLKRWTFHAVSNALVSVDTFFTLSGTLLAYLTMKELQKKGTKLNWGMYYFHRFWRLTPPYMLVLMVYVSLFPFTGSGPVWKQDGVEYNYCEKAWYYNLLYINNFFDKPEDSCMVWSWYLANDMQFFILSPLIIVPLFFFPIVGFGVILAFLVGTWVATGVMATKWDVAMSMFDGGKMDHWGKMYFRSYFRMGPYLVGLVAGYLLYKTDFKFRMNKFLNILGWLVAAVLACLVLYGQYDDINNGRLSRDVSSLYTTVHRTVWGAAVAWVIFACANGYGGYVNTILSWKGFIPLSRLTYCAYLVHPIVIYYYMYTRQRPIHFTDIEIIYQFLGHLGLSYAVAFVVSLAFESPMMGLEKVIFKRESRTK